MLMIAAILKPVIAGTVISVVTLDDLVRKIFYACTVIVTDLAAVLAAMTGDLLQLGNMAEGVSIIFRRIRSAGASWRSRCSCIRWSCSTPLNI